MARSHDVRQRTATDMRDPVTQARMIVMEAANEYLSKDNKIELDDVYIVWFTYVLSNWKALVSTTVPDNRYYEVTHKAADETFCDVYVKERQKIVPVDDPVHNV